MRHAGAPGCQASDRGDGGIGVDQINFPGADLRFNCSRGGLDFPHGFQPGARAQMFRAHPPRHGQDFERDALAGELDCEFTLRRDDDVGSDRVGSQTLQKAEKRARGTLESVVMGDAE